MSFPLRYFQYGFQALAILQLTVVPLRGMEQAQTPATQAALQVEIADKHASLLMAHLHFRITINELQAYVENSLETLEEALEKNVTQYEEAYECLVGECDPVKANSLTGIQKKAQFGRSRRLQPSPANAAPPARRGRPKKEGVAGIVQAGIERRLTVALKGARNVVTDLAFEKRALRQHPDLLADYLAGRAAEAHTLLLERVKHLAEMLAWLTKNKGMRPSFLETKDFKELLMLLPGNFLLDNDAFEELNRLAAAAEEEGSDGKYGATALQLALLHLYTMHSTLRTEPGDRVKREG